MRARPAHSALLAALVFVGAALSLASPAGAAAAFGLTQAESDTVLAARLAFGGGEAAVAAESCRDADAAFAPSAEPGSFAPGAAPDGSDPGERTTILAQNAPTAAGSPQAGAATEWVAPPKNFLRAFGEVFMVNAVVWAYNRYIRPGGGVGFHISLDAYEDHILNGFEWDDNNFDTNQFAHPYHGSLYFNAARANGYDFWESIPFAFAGSYMWEFFGEEHRPAMNDWINTSVGGTALGEMLFRLSNSVLDNTATGSNRTWREIGGFLISPVHGFNRLVTGEMFRTGPNPPDRKPIDAYLTLEAGTRTVGEDRVWESDTTRAFVNITGAYGSLFREDGGNRKPFDYFDVTAQVNFGDASALGRIQERGLLWSTPIGSSHPGSTHLVTIFQHYDYINTFAYEFGAQSLNAGISSRFVNGANTFTTSFGLTGILIGATNDDYENFTGRGYDYGPGLGFRVGAAFSRNGKPIALIRHSSFWIETVNGTPSDHYVTISAIKAQVPFSHAANAGFEWQVYTADRRYKDYEDVYQRTPEFHAFLSWQFD